MDRGSEGAAAALPPTGGERGRRGWPQTPESDKDNSQTRPARGPANRPVAPLQLRPWESRRCVVRWSVCADAWSQTMSRPRRRHLGAPAGYSPTPIASTGRERSARRVGSARASSASSAETPRIAASWPGGTYGRMLPVSAWLSGSIRPYVPPGQLAAILGVSALLALLALALPTRRALRSRPVEAIGVGE